MQIVFPIVVHCTANRNDTLQYRVYRVWFCVCVCVFFLKTTVGLNQFLQNVVIVYPYRHHYFTIILLIAVIINSSTFAPFFFFFGGGEVLMITSRHQRTSTTVQTR